MIWQVETYTCHSGPIAMPASYSSASAFLPGFDRSRLTCASTPSVVEFRLMDANVVLDVQDPKAEFVPKTALVKKIADIRRRALASGLTPLSDEELKQFRAQLRNSADLLQEFYASGHEHVEVTDNLACDKFLDYE